MFKNMKFDPLLDLIFLCEKVNVLLSIFELISKLCTKISRTVRGTYSSFEVRYCQKANKQGYNYVLTQPRCLYRHAFPVSLEGNKI